MRAFDILKLRIHTLIHQTDMERELDAEMQFHLDQQTLRNLAGGMTEDEARATALRLTGGIAQFKEECREARGFSYLQDVIQDLRYAIRTMRRSRVITAVAVLSLALGIGANTAVFSLINAVMLRSLPVSHPEHLVHFGRVLPNGSLGSFSYPLLRALGESMAGTADLMASNRLGTARVVAQGSAEPEQAVRELVTGNYFSVLGVNAVLGRTIIPDDNRAADGTPVAVLSYSYWKRRFGQDPAVLGKNIAVSNVPLTIVGIAPPDFFGVETGSSTDIWVPVSAMPEKKWLAQPGFNFLRVVGRLREGSTFERARANAGVVMARFVAARLGPNADPRRRQQLLDQRLDVEPASAGLSALRERFSEPLRILLVIVGAVLLVACSNLANLQLARASAREKEIGVRMAIGAGRARLIRQLLVESMLLALLGGACGVGFAYWGCQALLHFVPQADIPLVIDVHPNGRVLLFTLGVSIASAILFGLGPALRGTRTNLDSALKAESRSACYNPARRWLERSLITGQVALSMLLLAGSGLFIWSLIKLETLDTGFDRGPVLTFSISIQGSPEGQAARDLARRVAAAAQAVPGVHSASYTFAGLYGSGGWDTSLRVPGYTPGPNEPETFDGALVGPGYFETMGIPLIAGRTLTEKDNETGPKVIVINQSMAKHFFGGASALGRRIHFERPEGGVDAEVIGVVRDARLKGARKAAPAMFYAPSLQTAGPFPVFVVRAAGNAHAVGTALSQALRGLQPGLAVQDLLTLEDQVNNSFARERMIASVSGFFAVLALLLACIGIYGTLAYSVSRRTAEVGIRMTLGARREEVLWMILREALVLVSGGVVLGALAARGATKWAASLLFGLEPGDITTIVIAAIAMLLVALVAGYVPARRAAALDPMSALRYE